MKVQILAENRLVQLNNTTKIVRALKEENESLKQSVQNIIHFRQQNNNQQPTIHDELSP